MKYLITGKPGTTPIPREQGAVLLQAVLEWTKAKLADGTLDAAYNIIGGAGTAIANAETHEEILTLLLEYPLYPFFSWEITPLLDFEDSAKQYIESYKRMGSP
jgi:hypothetical protein